jgi:hypothetical protein
MHKYAETALQNTKNALNHVAGGCMAKVEEFLCISWSENP